MTIDSYILNQRFQDSSPSGQQMYTINWRCVSDIALDPLNDAAMKSIRDATCLEPLSPLPGVTHSVTGFLTTLRLRQYTITPVVGGERKIFDVQGVYSSEYGWANISGAGGSDKLVLPVTIEMEANERTVNVWRVASSPSAFALPPLAIYGKSYDIGGTKVDEAGKPIEIRVPTMDVRVSMLVDTHKNTLGVVYDKINTIQGRWNSDTFLWWSASEVFCTSANAAPVRDEIYRVSFNIRWDYWKDCVQIPEMDNDGGVLGDGSGKAKNVFWSGPARGTVAFATIWSLSADSTLAAQMAKEGTWLTYP